MQNIRPKHQSGPQVTDKALRPFVGYQLKRAYSIIRADLLKHLEPLGLRITTYSALVLVVENPGLRQSALATALDIKRSNMVGIIDDLESNGWVERKPVPEDRRAFALYVTKAGQRTCDAALSVDRKHESRVLKNLSAVELKGLTRLLKKIESIPETNS